MSDPRIHPENHQTSSSIQQIITLFLAKRYMECLKMIDVAYCDDMTQMRILQASCWTQLGIKTEETEHQLQEIIQSEPNNAFAFYGLGLSYYLLGDFGKCIGPFTRAFELNESAMARADLFKGYAMNVLKLFKDASAEFTAGRCSKALEILSLATLVDPENAAIKRLVKQQSDRFLQKVVGSLEVVLEDEDLDMMLSHVSFLVRSGKFIDADKLMPKDELLTNSRGWFIKGQVKYMMGSIKLSLVCFNKALSMDQNMIEAMDLKIKAEKFVAAIEAAQKLMNEMENSKAVEVLNEALDIDNENKRLVQAIYFQRAAAKFNMGKQEEAFNDYLLFESLQNITGIDGPKF
jgi:tetratricopeptide (TPR) repeat protein